MNFLKPGFQKMMLPLMLALIMLSGQSLGQGISGQQAPAWGVPQWKNLPNGKTTLDVSDLKGKVIFLYNFQSWCPGCHKHGFPTLQKLVKRFEGEEDMIFVAVQTVFEGFSTNTDEAAWKTAKKYNLEIPVGHDDGKGKGSGLMRRYRAGGTPWVVIIDSKGLVRFDDFHVDPDGAEKYLKKLLSER